MNALRTILLAAALAACTSAPLTGDVVLDARSEALGNVTRSGGNSPGAPAVIRLGVCNETDLSECGVGAEHERILAAGREGRLYFRYPDGSLRRYQR